MRHELVILPTMEGAIIAAQHPHVASIVGTKKRVVSLQGGIDRGWFRAPRSTKDGKPHLPSILAIASDIVSAMAYLHAVSDSAMSDICSPTW